MNIDTNCCVLLCVVILVHSKRCTEKNIFLSNTFLNQDTFTWEATWHKILSRVVWRKKTISEKIKIRVEFGFGLNKKGRMAYWKMQMYCLPAGGAFGTAEI